MEDNAFLFIQLNVNGSNDLQTWQSKKEKLVSLSECHPKANQAAGCVKEKDHYNTTFLLLQS